MSNVLTGTAALVLAFTAAPSAAAPARCDESCLLGVAGQYMDSLTANDPSTAPMAPGARSTENGAATPLTEGVWKTATGWRYRHTFVDPVAGTIGVMGTVREGEDHDAMIAIRLKVANRKVTESELMVARQGDFALFEPRWTIEPKPVFQRFTPPDRPMTRAQLETIARGYFQAIVHTDASLVSVHPDANRVENGYQTTNSPNRPSASITEGMQRFVYMHAYHQLRFPVIDTRRGLAWGVLAFDMPAMTKTIMIRGKPVQISPEANHLPRTMFLYELFKIEDGRIVAIEAVMRNMPLGADMGWPGEPSKP